METELKKILVKSLDFLIEMIVLSRTLANKDQAIISKSLLQCSSNISININEAIEFNARAGSKSKLAKAAEEAGETLYWLKRIEKAQLMDDNFPAYISHCQDLIGILLVASHS